MEVTGVLVTNLLSELGHLSRIDGMAAFAGIDGMGREFTVLEDELPVYIANTQRVLNSVKDSSGEIVGLPIDMGQHDWMGGAGWIVGLELDAPRKIIIFLVNWTEDGVECIAGNTMRFFSPAFDTEKKIIMGGALLNQPGSRNAKGQYLLRPVELSKSMSTIQKEKDMTVETVPEVKPSWATAIENTLAELSARFNPKKPDKQQEPLEKSVRELMESPEAIIEMSRRAEEIAANKNALFARQQHVIQLAADLVGGTAKRPIGLAGVRADEVVELLMGLPMPQSQAVENLIVKLMDASMLLNFQELGSSGGGYARKPRVPAEYRSAIHEWVNAGKQLSAWFTQVMPEVGKAEDFNLTEFVKEA